MPLEYILFGVGVASIGFYLWLNRVKQVHANIVENIQFPDGWQVQRNEPVTGLSGAIDLLAKDPAGQLFAINVKSHIKLATYQKNFFGEALVMPDGRKLVNPCPMAETLTFAQVAGAIPVLWLPNVRKERPRKSKHGVHVVFGPRRVLFKILKKAK